MVASLVGDPARSNMLTALMTGRALTASELAHEAGVTPQTASSHLAKLEAGGLIEQEKQGRHRYYRLTDPDVAAVLEGLEALAARAGHMRVRTGQRIRRCAGRGLLRPSRRRTRRADARQHEAAEAGAPAQTGPRADRRRPTFMAKSLQISAEALAHPRRPLARPASTGASGAIISPARGGGSDDRFAELKWAARDPRPAAASSISPAMADKRFAALSGANEELRIPIYSIVAGADLTGGSLR